MANGFLEYGNHKVVIADVPVSVLHALAQTTFSHKMGNEVAAKVNGRIKSAIGDPEADSTAIAAWRESNKPQVDAWFDQFRNEMCEAIIKGTVGTRVGGPRKDPFEAKFHSLVLQDIVARLKGSRREGLAKAFRAAAKTGNPIDFGGVGPDGKPNVRTREQMIAATITQHGDRLRKEAEKMVREEQRLAANAEKQAGAVEGATPEALGF